MGGTSEACGQEICEPSAAGISSRASPDLNSGSRWLDGQMTFPFLLEVSPAMTLVARDAAKARSTESEADCGGKRCGWCAVCDPIGRCLRTRLIFELKATTQLRSHWKRRVTPAGRSWWVLGTPEHNISATEFGSLLDQTLLSGQLVKKTAYQYDAGDHTKPRTTLVGKLLDPTMRASLKEHSTTKRAPSHGVTHGKVLSAEVFEAERTVGQRTPVCPSMTGSQAEPLITLNPAWCLAFMGYPVDWLD